MKRNAFTSVAMSVCLIAGTLAGYRLWEAGPTAIYCGSAVAIAWFAYLGVRMMWRPIHAS